MRFKCAVPGSLLFMAVSASLFTSPAAAQQEGIPLSNRLRVYFDCQGQECDSSYYRTEIAWVDWVRDPQDSHVHVIMTSQSTGAGGREYLLDFLGRGVASEYSSQSRYQASSVATQRERLDAVAYTLGLGLAQFSNTNGFPSFVRLEPLDSELIAQDLGVVAPDVVDDPWNFWTFRINANGNFDGEQTREEYQIRTGLSASRVTPTWKTNLSGNWNLTHREIQRTDGSLFIDDRVNWSANAQIVFAIAPHWSVGMSGGPARMTTQNQSLRVQANPAIEFSYFPYEEATRRALTFFYEIGPVYRDYMEETIFGKMSEVRAEHALTIDFSQRQPWGTAYLTAAGSSYLHDFERYNLSLRGGMSYRITRGLDLNVNANISSVQDQIYLSGKGLTEEERLLRTRQEATDYRYGGSFGLAYQFGSIFNNIVNNRF